MSVGGKYLGRSQPPQPSLRPDHLGCNFNQPPSKAWCLTPGRDGGAGSAGGPGTSGARAAEEDADGRNLIKIGG